MQVPDNYSRFEIEERRLYDVEYICCMCEAGFTDDEMSEDPNYCETCYNELEQFEIEEE